MDIKQLKQLLSEHNLRISSEVQQQLASQNCQITTDVVCVIADNTVQYMTEAPHFQGSYALQHIGDLLMEYSSKAELANIDKYGIIQRCISHKRAVEILLQEYYSMLSKQGVKNVVAVVEHIKHRRSDTCL